MDKREISFPVQKVIFLSSLILLFLTGGASILLDLFGVLLVVSTVLAITSLLMIVHCFWLAIRINRKYSRAPLYAYHLHRWLAVWAMVSVLSVAFAVDGRLFSFSGGMPNIGFIRAIFVAYAALPVIGLYAAFRGVVATLRAGTEQTLSDDVVRRGGLSAEGDFVVIEGRGSDVDEASAPSTSLMDTVSRLKDDLLSLTTRARVNLQIGIGIAITGVLYLGWAISLPSEQELTHLARTVTFTVTVELLALFFLRLHRSILSEIRETHNELTNREARLAAYEIAFFSDRIPDQAMRELLLNDLLSTERNPVLLENQQTKLGERLSHDEKSTADIKEFLRVAFSNARRKENVPTSDS